MKTPDLEEWREYLLKTGYNKGHASAKAEYEPQVQSLKSQLNIISAAAKAETEAALKAAHLIEIAQIKASHESVMTAQRLNYEKTINSRTDEIRHLKHDLDELKKKNR